MPAKLSSTFYGNNGASWKRYWNSAKNVWRGLSSSISAKTARPSNQHPQTDSSSHAVK
jgi:hypothetical protein